MFLRQYVKNFNKDWFFSQKHMFLQNVTLNTYKVVLTTRLKIFDQKVKKKLKAIIIARNMKVFENFASKKQYFFFSKLELISKNFSRNWSKANMPILASGLFEINKLKFQPYFKNGGVYSSWEVRFSPFTNLFHGLQKKMRTKHFWIYI